MIFYGSFNEIIAVNKEHKQHKVEPSQDENGYDHLNMHHHPGNAKQENDLSLPEKLPGAHKTNSIKPGETLHKKIRKVDFNHSHEVC